MNKEEIISRMSAIKPWFHSIDLGNGITTPGAGSFEFLTDAADVYLGMGVKGLSVLDVGAWDGFFSFAAERRGAARVLAVDKFCWGGGGPGNRKAFEFARNIIGSKVENKIIDIPDMSVDTVGQHDLVLFAGIIYHIFNPLSALEQMAKIARHAVVIETFLDNIDNPRPVMVFYRGEKQPAGQPQKGWGANSYCMHAILKQLGFETVLEFQTPHEKMFNRSVFVALKPGHPFGDYVEKNIAFAKPRLTPDSVPPV